MKQTIQQYMLQGTTKKCYKCGVVSQHHTACLSCLNAMREEHEKHEQIWDISPRDSHSLGQFNDEIIRQYGLGVKAGEIARKINVPVKLVASLIMKLTRDGVLNRRSYS